MESKRCIHFDQRLNKKNLQTKSGWTSSMLGLVKQRQEEQPGWGEVSGASDEWGQKPSCSRFHGLQLWSSSFWGEGPAILHFITCVSMTYMFSYNQCSSAECISIPWALAKIPGCVQPCVKSLANGHQPLTQGPSLDNSLQRDRLTSVPDRTSLKTLVINSLPCLPGPPLLLPLGKTWWNLPKSTLCGLSRPIRPYPRNPKAGQPQPLTKACAQVLCLRPALTSLFSPSRHAMRLA